MFVGVVRLFEFRTEIQKQDFLLKTQRHIRK